MVILNGWENPQANPVQLYERRAVLTAPLQAKIVPVYSKRHDEVVSQLSEFNFSSVSSTGVC